MELVPNNLYQEIKNNNVISPEFATQIIVKVCDALAFAHDMGYAHRDIKPHNILLTDEGVPKLSDFGISKATEFAVATSSIGTPAYMSPEQCKGIEEIDTRSDIYSLG